MFDIGFTELLLVSVITLVVLGPEKLPQAIRTTAYWMGKVRAMFQTVKDELAREIDLEGIKQQVDSVLVTKEFKETRDQLQSQIDELKDSASIHPGKVGKVRVNATTQFDSAEKASSSLTGSEVTDESEGDIQQSK